MSTGLDLSWPSSPGTLVFLLVLCLIYVLALRQAVRRPNEQPIPMYRVVCFFAAIIIMALVLLTPIDTIARTQLFSVHIAQAVVLTTVCSPLILAGCTEGVMRSLVGFPVLGALIRICTRPLVASLTFNLLFLLWHAPRPFQAAMMNEGLYQLQMVSIFAASLCNWYPLIGSLRELRSMGYPIQMLYAFFDGQPVDIFAFVLVFTGTVFYPHYAIPTSLGLSPFADQTVGGALLLIPGLVDLVVMTPLFFRWLNQMERQTVAADQRRQEEEEWEDEFEENELEEPSEAQ